VRTLQSKSRHTKQYHKVAGRTINKWVFRPSDVSTQSWHFYWRWPDIEDTHVTYGIEMFHRTSSAATGRRLVLPTTLQTPVVILVLSRLDYGNGVLIGLPAYFLRRLQSVLVSQNSPPYLACEFRRVAETESSAAALGVESGTHNTTSPSRNHQWSCFPGYSCKSMQQSTIKCYIIVTFESFQVSLENWVVYAMYWVD